MRMAYKIVIYRHYRGHAKKRIFKCGLAVRQRIRHLVQFRLNEREDQHINNNGMRLIHIAMERNMVIFSNKFQYLDIHKAPGYLLIKKQIIKFIMF